MAVTILVALKKAYQLCVPVMKKKSKSLHSRLIRHLREWHRKLGIIAAFFIIFLSISGVALNHTTTLSLAHLGIKSTWLLDHYGIAAPEDIRFYPLNENTIQITNNHLWLNEKLLLETSDVIIAASYITLTDAPSSRLILVASRDYLYLFNLKGELIDQIDDTLGLPQSINALSVQGQQVIIRTPTGNYQTTTDFFEWQPVSFVAEPSWIAPSQVSTAAIAKASLAYRAQFLSLERIILDAHSGRILGLFGVLLMDAVAILLILLSVSGVYMWIRHSRARR
ncbi:hypothetical protein NBRC116592_23400 [Colwellia sp. KU-HH00111]|uniref:PepSY-associated TM helix domain-containing protein n=1 Tax=Colwellia sp. KU-HH00111 TaxID=3127652 RepID=UPI00310467B6